MPPSPPAVAAPAPEIVVTGRGLSAVAGDAAYDVVTIDRDRLNATASGRLEDVLRDVAGFQQYRRSDSNSANPTSQGVTLRGLGGNASSRALVVLDGVPETDPFGGNITFPAIDPARLGQVRVTRGGGSGVNGPGALAGTIELDSASLAETGPVAGSVAYGSRNSVDAAGSLATRAGDGFATVFGAYQRGDGFIPIVASQRGPADQPSDYRQVSLGTRAVVPIGDAAELQGSLLGFSDKRQRGLAGTANSTTGADASVRLVRRGAWGFEALGYVQVRQFKNGFASANAARTLATVTADQYNVPATGLGGKIELRPPIGGGFDLRLGIDARMTVGETDEFFTYVAGVPTRTREAGGSTLTTGAYADLSWSATDALTLTGGGRIDRWWIRDGRLRERTIATGAFVTNTAYPDRDGTRPTARGGAVYRLGGGLSVRGAAYLGWRLPTLNELYRPFRAGLDATGANPALKPERLKGVAGGIDWQPLPSVRLSATAFSNRLEDAIGNVTRGVGPGTFAGVGFVAAGGAFRQRANLDAVSSQGVEVEGRATTGVWTLSGSWAIVDAHVVGSGASAALDGLRPAQTPRNQVSGTLGYGGLRGLRAAATFRYVSSQYEDDQNSRRLVSATTLDLTAGLPIATVLGTSLQIEARAQNVTNTQVVATLAADGTIERATPRTLWIGLRLGG